MNKIAQRIIFYLLLVPTSISGLLADNFDSLMSLVEMKYSTVQDYECIFSKTEYINGDYYSWKDVIYKHQRPDKYYLKWTNGFYEGSEVVYAGKKYNYQMVGHLGGILNLKNFYLDPKGSIAMTKNRHSIFESDLGYIIQMIRKNLEHSKSQNVGKIHFINDIVLNHKRTSKFKAEFPANKGFYGNRIYIYLDKSLLLPVKFEVYDWNGILIESYSFFNLKINTGLKELEFDISNKLYNF